MWQVKQWKAKRRTPEAMAEAKAKMERWIERHGHRYQTRTVFIDNGYALDVRRLRVIG